MLAAPREIVSRVGKPLEMARSGKRTFCCGAGGAHMWMEERGSQINEERAREAAETGAGTLAVACPFCTVMLDDGVQQIGGELRVADVATLLAEALESVRGSGVPRLVPRSIEVSASRRPTAVGRLRDTLLRPDPRHERRDARRHAR